MSLRFVDEKEAIKPVTDAGSPADAKRTTQDTLYTCLEQALKLLHPFMPFVTEELYQRLPRRPGDIVESIMKTAYPTEVPEWSAPEAEAEFDFIIDAVKAARSLSVSNNVAKFTVGVITTSQRRAEAVTDQRIVVKALIKGCQGVTVAQSLEAFGTERPVTQDLNSGDKVALADAK
ncbi:MAG: hypothetical protein BJ554DRAFT_3279 [Olpidium bornovanus]|uniref:valine--tRNA ligase n=1 Tax=Olpidium bornovanus TaxID=278681 RepID=A0A8H8A0N7_9FUNG|nr:MAG: hypothetical protein BJ554DRAFT_3279 [Olpidium bornovanus]